MRIYCHALRRILERIRKGISILVSTPDLVRKCLAVKTDLLGFPNPGRHIINEKIQKPCLTRFIALDRSHLDRYPVTALEAAQPVAVIACPALSANNLFPEIMR